MTGLIFDIKRFAIHDGPGIRTTVFMKGCPLRCKWCQNPESLEPYPEVAFMFKWKCIDGCKKCLEVCPVPGAIGEVEDEKEINRVQCIKCLKCAEICNPGAMTRIGEYVTVEGVLEEVEKDSVFYRRSGGGVTFSGGEPLMQPKFIHELSKRCRDKGVHVTLDTSGYTKWKIIKGILPYVNLVLYDIKHMDPVRHREGTGKSNELILRNAENVFRKVETIVRIPVIPGFNDSEENIEDTAAFVASVGNVKQIDLLPYHQFGEPKYKIMGRVYELEGTQPPSEKQMQTLKKIVENYGFNVTVPG